MWEWNRIVKPRQKSLLNSIRSGTCEDRGESRLGFQWGFFCSLGTHLCAEDRARRRWVGRAQRMDRAARRRRPKKAWGGQRGAVAWVEAKRVSPGRKRSEDFFQGARVRWGRRVAIQSKCPVLHLGQRGAGWGRRPARSVRGRSAALWGCGSWAANRVRAFSNRSV